MACAANINTTLAAHVAPATRSSARAASVRMSAPLKQQKSNVSAKLLRASKRENSRMVASRAGCVRVVSAAADAVATSAQKATCMCKIGTRG
eukprot:5569523-Pyramimonas_sp.AAC.1